MRIFLRILTIAVYLFGFQYMIIAEGTPLPAQLQSVLGAVAVFAPLALTLVIAIFNHAEYRGIRWGLTALQAAVLGWVLLLAYFANEKAATLITWSMYIYYFGGAFLCWGFTLETLEDAGDWVEPPKDHAPGDWTTMVGDEDDYDPAE